MMRNLLSFVVLASSLVLLNGAAASQGKGKGKAKGKTMTLTGCLKSGTEANTFMLTNVTGDTKEYELLPEAGVNLKPHVGHKVEVTGTRLSTKEAMKMEGEPSKGKAKKEARKEEARENHVKVTALKHISPTCP